jgi:hypothetical protein
MTQQREQPREAGDGQQRKRKYDPPQIVSQAVFETTALACGKLPSQGGACTANKKTS